MNDLKYAFRTLVRSPAFTLIAIITLALGIGASTAIFSVLDAVLLRPLPYPNQERLVEISELNEAGRGMPFAEPNFNDLATRNRSLEAIAAYTRSPDAVSGGIEPVRTNVSGFLSRTRRNAGNRPPLFCGNTARRKTSRGSELWLLEEATGRSAESGRKLTSFC
jgi:hypothetical protein